MVEDRSSVRYRLITVEVLGRISRETVNHPSLCQRKLQTSACFMWTGVVLVFSANLFQSTEFWSFSVRTARMKNWIFSALLDFEKMTNE